MPKSVKIKEEAQKVVETIRNPSGVATGDALSDLVRVAVEKDHTVSSDDLIVLLQESGFHSADGLQDFINARISFFRNKIMNDSSL